MSKFVQILAFDFCFTIRTQQRDIGLLRLCRLLIGTVSGEGLAVAMAAAYHYGVESHRGIKISTTVLR